MADLDGDSAASVCNDDGGGAPDPGTSGAPSDARYWVGAASASLSAEHNLGALATGLVKNTAGTPSIAVAGTDYQAPLAAFGSPGVFANPDSITVSALGLITAITAGAAKALQATQIIAGAGLTGGGTLAADRTLNVVAGDGTIVVNADSIQAGVMQTANYADTSVTSAKFRNSIAKSVVGRAANSGGTTNDIQAGATGTLLRFNGTDLEFGQLLPGSVGGTQTNGFVVTLVAGVPTWAAAAGGGGTIDGSGAATRVAIWSDADTLTSDAGFTLASNTLTLSAAASGAAVTAVVSNSSNTASATALHHVQVAGSTADDAMYRASISGGASWTWGLDNSTGDDFVISSGNTLRTTPVFIGSTAAATGTIVQNTTGNGKLNLDDSTGTVLRYGGNHSITIDTSRILATVNGTVAFNLANAGAVANAAFFGTGSFGSGAGVISVANATTVPSGNPTGGGIEYWESGKKKLLDPDGVVTQLN